MEVSFFITFYFSFIIHISQFVLFHGMVDAVTSTESFMNRTCIRYDIMIMGRKSLKLNSPAPKWAISSLEGRMFSCVGWLSSTSFMNFMKDLAARVESNTGFPWVRVVTEMNWSVTGNVWRHGRSADHSIYFTMKYFSNIFLLDEYGSALFKAINWLAVQPWWFM